jgi:sugar/nucleoside kinase (ribokinase family)
VIAGGKGANQAVAVARLSRSARGGDDGGAPAPRFGGQFVNDAHARMLEEALVADGVDVSGCGRCASHPSGQGFVFLEVYHLSIYLHWVKVC